MQELTFARGGREVRVKLNVVMLSNNGQVLVDAMRGRSSTWTRVRVNLQHVPVALRPSQEPPDSSDAITDGIDPPRKPSRARKRA